MAGRKTKALAEARKRLVLHYFLRGAGSSEIAQSLRQHPQFEGGVSERQVRRDIRELETQLHELTPRLWIGGVGPRIVAMAPDGRRQGKFDYGSFFFYFDVLLQ